MGKQETINKEYWNFSKEWSWFFV